MFALVLKSPDGEWPIKYTFFYTSERELFIYSFAYPRASRRRLKFARLALLNVVFEEFVLSSLIASPLIKPLFTPGGWREVKWVY